MLTINCKQRFKTKKRKNCNLLKTSFVYIKFPLHFSLPWTFCHDLRFSLLWIILVFSDYFLNAFQFPLLWRKTFLYSNFSLFLMLKSIFSSILFKILCLQCFFSFSFIKDRFPKYGLSFMWHVVTENKFGKGVWILMYLENYVWICVHAND